MRLFLSPLARLCAAYAMNTVPMEKWFNLDDRIVTVMEDILETRQHAQRDLTAVYLVFIHLLSLCFDARFQKVNGVLRQWHLVLEQHSVAQ